MLRTLTLILATALLIGCERTPTTSPSSHGTPPDDGTYHPTSFSAEEAVQLKLMAAQFAEAVRSGDSSAVSAFLDNTKFAERSFEGLEVSESSKQMEDFLRGLSQNGGMAGAFLGQRYKFLRIHPINGEDRLIFRLLPDPGGVNYHGIRVEKNDAGEFKFVDFYSFTNGEDSSKAVRRFLLPVIAQENKSTLAKLLSKTDIDYIDHFTKIKKLTELYQDGEPEKAIQLYHNLPESLQKEKSVMVICLSVLADLDDDKYLSKMEEFNALFAGDPSTSLMMIDYSLLKEDYDKCLEMISGLSSLVGGDHYLDVLKAGCLLDQGNVAEAKALVDNVLKMEPELEDSYWTGLNIGLKSSDYGTCGTLLRELETRFGYQFDRTILAEDDMYKGFLESQQGLEMFPLLPGAQPDTDSSVDSIEVGVVGELE